MMSHELDKVLETYLKQHNLLYSGVLLIQNICDS